MMKKILILLTLLLLTLFTTLNANTMQEIEKFNITLEKAKNGDSDAKYILALAYFEGKGTQKDTNRGYYWLKNAIEDGNLQAILTSSKINLSASSDNEAQGIALRLPDLLVNYEKYFPKEYTKNEKKVKKYKALALMYLAKHSKDNLRVSYYLKAFDLKEIYVVDKDLQKEAIEYFNTHLQGEALLKYRVENEDFSFIKNSLDDFKGINEFYTINKYLPKTARYRVDMTPLLMAIQNDEITFAKELIEHGADINLANSRGETPLLCAMRNNHIGLAKELLQQGADTSVLDVAKNSVLSYAIVLGREDIALEVLRNKKFDIHQWVDGSVFGGKFDAYAEYIHINKYDKGTFSYLHLAARYGANAVIKKLIDMGLDVNATMRSDRLALDALGIATRYASLESMKLLLVNGANPYIVYKNSHPEGNYGLHYWGGLSTKYTPLSMAVCREKQDDKMVEHILRLESAKWYVEHESEYFYFYLLTIDKVSHNKENIYTRVLQFFDDNGFKNKEKIRDKFDAISKSKG
jgi:hypothetical protein